MTKHIVQTTYGKSRVYQQSAPDAQQHILIVPGYSGAIIQNRKIVDYLAKKGYNAFTYSQPRGWGGPTSDVIDRKEDIILNVLSATVPEDKKVYAVGYSFGAAPLLQATLESPERFMGLFLMQPSGITGKMSFLDLVLRVGMKTMKNPIHALIGRKDYSHAMAADQIQQPQPAGLGEVAYNQFASGGIIIKNPLLALKEARAAITHSIIEDIAAVERIGIDVSVIKSHSDELFNVGEANLTYEQIVQFEGAYLNVADRYARHDAFWTRPKRSAELIDELIQYASLYD